MTENEQQARNTIARQHMTNALIASNPRIQTGQATIYPPQTAMSGSGLVGHAAQGTSSTWGSSSASQQSRKSIRIDVDEVENGRLVGMGNKQYIVAPGQSLIEVIGQALVEAKLEE